MGNSVEGRFPFLDHRVIEFCCKLPPNIRMQTLTEKYILKKSMSGLYKEPLNTPLALETNSKILTCINIPIHSCHMIAVS